MEELTKTEERIMQVVWRLKKAFVKDIIAQLDDDPKPPYSTIASVVGILEKKGYLTHTAYGKTHEYFPAVSKAAYRKMYFQRMLSQYFDNSETSLLSFLVQEKKLSEGDIEKLKDLINKPPTS